MLPLIKLWLKTPIEERDADEKRPPGGQGKGKSNILKTTPRKVGFVTAQAWRDHAAEQEKAVLLNSSQPEMPLPDKSQGKPAPV